MKARLSEEDIVNHWLEKYHNTNTVKVLKDHPEWDDDKDHSREFYNEYQVTQEQHDEWQLWTIKAIAKDKKVSQKYVKKSWWMIHLNSSPMILINKKQ